MPSDPAATITTEFVTPRFAHNWSLALDGKNLRAQAKGSAEDGRGGPARDGYVPGMIAILIALALPCGAPTPVPSDGWVLASSRDGMEVWNRPTSDGRTAWIKGVATDDVPMEVLGEVLLDVPRYPLWMRQLRESRVVERVSADDYVVYNRYAVPWPFQDRDVYVRVRIDRRPSEGLVVASVLRTESPRHPPVPGVVRIPRMEGYLTLRSLGRSRTRGEFAELVDIGGDVPEWGKGILNRRMPAYVLARVRQACREPAYRRAADTSSLRRELDAAVRAGLIPP